MKPNWRNIRVTLLFAFNFFLVLAIAGGLLWANLHFTQRFPGGQEFLPVWKSAQNFIFRSISPYEELNSLEAQGLVYGRPALLGEPSLRFDQPLYLVLIYLPFAAIFDRILARAVWMVVLEIALAALLALSLRLARWRPHPILLFFLLLFSVFWLPSALALRAASPVILLSLLLFGAIRAVDANADELAGALLAFSLFNIQVGAALILSLLLWAATSQRWRIWAGFGMTLVVGIGISYVLLPSWPWAFFRAAVATWREAMFGSTFVLFRDWLPGIGVPLSRGLALGAVILLAVEWLYHRGRDSRWLLWVSALTASATPLLGFPVETAHLVLLLPAFLVSISVMDQRWGVFGRSLAIFLLSGIFLVLWAQAWLGASLISARLWLPLLSILLLYWVRWWVIRPPRVWADLISRESGGVSL